MIQKYCNTCENKFYAKPSHVKRGWGKYCSRKCHHQGMRVGKIVQCFTCNKDIHRNSNRIKRSKSKKYFCSKSCQTKWRNVQYVGSKHNDS